MATMATRTMSIRIEGTDSPARSCTGPDGVAIGIQRGKEVLETVPSSSVEPCFHAEVEVTGDGDDIDFRGPYTHGARGDRFLYLAWVGIRDGSMVARIKLKLADISPHLLEKAADGGTLVGRLSLVNAQGRPVSGSVRPPHVAWAVDT
jgi:hypothetical protein